MRFIILGLPSSGKTCLFHLLVKNQISYDHKPTQGFQAIEFIKNENKIDFWDVSGDVSTRSYWKSYTEDKDGLIWMVDGLDKDGVRESKEEFEKLIDFLTEDNDVPILLIFNMKGKKSDNLAFLLESISFRKLLMHPLCVIKVSQFKSKSIDSSFEWLIEKARNRKSKD